MDMCTATTGIITKRCRALWQPWPKEVLRPIENRIHDGRCPINVRRTPSVLVLARHRTSSDKQAEARKLIQVILQQTCAICAP
jgi:hypothetical protein